MAVHHQVSAPVGLLHKTVVTLLFMRLSASMHIYPSLIRRPRAQVVNTSLFLSSHVAWVRGYKYLVIQ